MRVFLYIARNKKYLYSLIGLFILSIILLVLTYKLDFTKALGGFVVLGYLIPYAITIIVYLIMRGKFKRRCTTCGNQN